ncbi:hypothetical protein L6164_009808 [Bauhinia variegata]|nr:hypothetical protein L6164_009808 [Bauhinia variegata]
MENREQSDNEKPSSQRESISVQEREIDPKDEEKLGFLKEREDSSREKIIKSENVEELKRRKKGEEEEEGSARPLVLTRCKSEPARTAHKLDPQVNLWKERRSGFTNSSSPLICD